MNLSADSRVAIRQIFPSRRITATRLIVKIEITPENNFLIAFYNIVTNLTSSAEKD